MTDPHSTTLALGEQSLPTDAQRAPIVHTKGGEVFADSRDVAAFFQKQHKNVIASIRDLIIKEPDLGRLNFQPFKINDLTGETTSHYEMDRRGFTLLAMGFNGDKALRFKLKYIDAFEAMETRLRQPTISFDPSDPAVMLACFQHLQKQVVDKEAIIVQQGQRLTTLDRIEGASGSMCITDAAKTLGVRRIRDLFALMSAHRWIYKRVGNSTWLARQEKIQAGLMEHDDHIYQDSSGHDRVATRALVTPKGLVKLAELLNKPLH